MFRRSGSTVAWYVDGKLPAPQSEEFVAALRNQRFRSIENAASEESSVGWVSSGDPTGASFELEDMDLDHAVWLRMRVDQKKLPTTWLGIYRAEAERSAGRKLSARERKEHKESVMSELLPRVLPSVQMIDALYDPDARLILLFGTSKNVREEFHKLFFRTFATNLIEADPQGLAMRVGLSREQIAYLDEVSPMPWARHDEQGDQFDGRRKVWAAETKADVESDAETEEIR